MNFLEQLSKQKDNLKKIETVVTQTDGRKYREKGGKSVPLSSSSYGFVVDTKPDDVPILILDNMYIGSQDSAVDDVLSKYNITNVLSLGISVESSFANKKHIDCLDLSENCIKLILNESLPFIRSCLQRKENVLIHCNAGVSRTSMVAIAYLMHYEAMEYEDAYKFVKDKRPAIQPNAGFKEQLKCLKAGHVIDNTH